VDSSSLESLWAIIFQNLFSNGSLFLATAFTIVSGVRKNRSKALDIKYSYCIIDLSVACRNSQDLTSIVSPVLSTEGLRKSNPSHYSWSSGRDLHPETLVDSRILIMGLTLTCHWTAAAFTGLLSVPGWVRRWTNERTFFFNFRKCGVRSGMILTGENLRTRRKTCPSATLSTINPTGLTRARTRAAAVRGRRLTAWAMAQPDSRLAK
jgi:hypothetical protein